MNDLIPSETNGTTDLIPSETNFDSNNGESSDFISAIANAVSNIATVFGDLSGADKQRKAEDESFARKFIPTPEAVFGRYAAQIDQTPLYLIGGFGMLIFVGLIALVTKKSKR